jgi:hypothetical protein
MLCKAFKICSFTTTSTRLSSNTPMKFFVNSMALLKMLKSDFELPLALTNGDTICPLQMKLLSFCPVRSLKHLATLYFEIEMGHYIKSVIFIPPMSPSSIRFCFLGVKTGGILTWFCMRVLGSVKIGSSKRNGGGKSGINVACTTISQHVKLENQGA